MIKIRNIPLRSRAPGRRRSALIDSATMLNTEADEMLRKSEAELERVLARLTAPSILADANSFGSRTYGDFSQLPQNTVEDNSPKSALERALSCTEPAAGTPPGSGAPCPQGKNSEEPAIGLGTYTPENVPGGPQRPEIGARAQSSTARVARINVNRWLSFIVMGMGLAGVGAVSMVSSIQGSQINVLTGRIAGHAKSISELNEANRMLNADVKTRLSTLQQLVAEVKYPNPQFQEAENLLRAGRYAEAESAYFAFLLRFPDSRVAEEALKSAAIAAGMRGSCQMAASYMTRLKQRFPESPLNVSAAKSFAECKKLQSQSAKTGAKN